MDEHELRTLAFSISMFVQQGYTGQRDDSCPRQTGARFHRATQNSTQRKAYELFISGILHLVLFGTH